MIDKEKIEKAVVSIIHAIGEDPKREGLVGTPRRIAEMYAEVFAGIYEDPKEELRVGFRRGAPRDGHPQRHSLLLHV
jgi:GTP cyclohydrolase I